MNSLRLLKILLILGGIVELVVGFLFIFVDQFLLQLGFEVIPLFTQMIAAFFLCFGILLIYSKRDMDKYKIIPLTNILLRIIIISFSLISIRKYSEFLIILLFAIPYDLIWALLVLILMRMNNIIFKKR
ncbi:MAG: hypothetical protein ACXABO_14065 [Promethearchaeota archaeon]